MTSYDNQLQSDLMQLWSLSQKLFLEAPTDREANFHAGLVKALNALMRGEPIPAEAWARMEKASLYEAYGL